MGILKHNFLFWPGILWIPSVPMKDSSLGKLSSINLIINVPPKYYSLNDKLKRSFYT